MFILREYNRFLSFLIKWIHKPYINLYISPNIISENVSLLVKLTRVNYLTDHYGKRTKDTLKKKDFIKKKLYRRRGKSRS